MVLGPRAHRGTPGLRLAKVLGSGHEGGFGLRPSASRQGLFLVFDGEAAADAFLAHGRAAQAYRAHAREFCTVKLRAFASRGHWDGRDIAVSAAAPASGTVAALTRASIRPLQAAKFWRLAPPAEASLAAMPGCRLAVGLGEAPLLRQATFSLWDDQAAMDSYARSGAHLQAIRAARRGNYLGERCSCASCRWPSAAPGRDGGMAERPLAAWPVRPAPAELPDARLPGAAVASSAKPSARVRDEHRVIGAGIGGLVSALLLACRGLPVTLVEAQARPAARCGRSRSTARRIDAGPTVFTMRWVFDEILAAAGTSVDATC
jgi:hypothetical protein